MELFKSQNVCVVLEQEDIYAVNVKRPNNDDWLQIEGGFRSIYAANEYAKRLDRNEGERDLAIAAIQQAPDLSRFSTDDLLRELEVRAKELGLTLHVKKNN